MGSDAENSEQKELPHPPSEIVEEVFSSMINSMPRTKEGLLDWCSDEDGDDEEGHVHGNPKVQKLAKTAKELYNRFKILHCQYLRYVKYENRNDVIFLLDEMLRHKFIM